MAFKSGDKRSGNFCDKTSQVTQRQMIIQSVQGVGRVRRKQRVLSRLSEKLRTSLPEQAAPLGMTKKQEREAIFLLLI